MTTNEVHELSKKLVEGVRAAVADRGRDWVYPIYDGTNAKWFDGDEATCVNRLPDGTPACIVGYAAVHAGLEIDRCGGVDAIFTSHPDLHGIQVDNAVYLALERAQALQDDRGSWGLALDDFERVLAENGWKD